MSNIEAFAASRQTRRFQGAATLQVDINERRAMKEAKLKAARTAPRRGRRERGQNGPTWPQASYAASREPLVTPRDNPAGLGHCGETCERCIQSFKKGVDCVDPFCKQVTARQHGSVLPWWPESKGTETDGGFLHVLLRGEDSRCSDTVPPRPLTA